MTADRDFKRLVRARMASTGENYTAARAALLAEHQRPADRTCTVCGDYVPPPEDLAAHLHAHYGAKA